jgi:3-methyladenine DNA glycosylase AlkD
MKPVAYIAEHIRRVIKDGGSAPHAAEVQWFFKEEVKSRGWYTAELRKVARRFERTLLNECGLEYLVQVADNLFSGDVLEEKVFAVFLLERQVAQLTQPHFELFAAWLDRVSNWADHDGLVHYLIGPLVALEQKRTTFLFGWAKSPNRWRRRAAAVSLIRGVRAHQYFRETERMTHALIADRDDMVQKGLGWLLREHAKANHDEALPLLMKIRDRAPRLVLRTGCETLPIPDKQKVLAKPAVKIKAKSASK